VSTELAGIPQLDREGVERKAELERRHWWYRGRTEVVRAALTRLPVVSGSRVLEVGCGTGHNLAWLEAVGPAQGLEVNPDAVEWARNAGRKVDTGDVEELPFADGEFGLLACFDVLEHVADDRTALAEMRRVTADGGTLLLTAPAYPRLFSSHDEAAGHRRRYARRPLLDLARAARWEPVLSTHFNLLLLPIAASLRLATRRRPARREARSDLLRTPAGLDRVLEWPLRAEAAVVRAGVSLPAGLSILLGMRAA
jgi:SAM-dependent methyltransferase